MGAFASNIISVRLGRYTRINSPAYHSELLVDLWWNVGVYWVNYCLFVCNSYPGSILVLQISLEENRKFFNSSRALYVIFFSKTGFKSFPLQK